MPDQIYIGNLSKGLNKYRLPFNIDNDAFPTLFNMYVWRGRAKKKRGTTTLGRLERQIVSVLVPTNPWESASFNLIPGFTPLIATFGLESSSNITPGSITFVGAGGQIFTEPSPPDGTLVGNLGGSGTINYANGDLTLTANNPITGSFSYYPGLPVMGLEDLVSNFANNKFPLLEAFDTKYSYQINQVSTPVFFYSTTFYKNSNVPFAWSAGDAAQFWSTNYQSAFWVTNNKPGFHFVNATVHSGSSTTNITFDFLTNGNFLTNLVIGDWVWFNEFTGSDINGVTGVVLDNSQAAIGRYVIHFLVNQNAAGSGITQLLTNKVPAFNGVVPDGIRWYDGDPTAGTGIPTGTGLGWVNFAPPLTATTIGINDQSPALYYLVGALAILPFKDRLLFFGPQIQSSTSAVIQLPLQDTVLWSWNGTPYYNSLVPTNSTNSETYDVTAYYVDQTGKGGYLPAGISQPIVTVLNNQDVLLLGFGGSGKKTRFVYTGDDFQPFLFYLINSELPSSCTFSGISMDKGGVEIGQYGITATTQQQCQRIDLDIPDEVFQIQSINNGTQRVNSIRDFFREWIYFSYPIGDGKESASSWKFPVQTLLFNYRDNTWAILRENFTHHGTFRTQVQYTWANPPFNTWNSWREPWNSGSSQALFPDIIAGNPQGFVLIKDEGTQEAPSGSITSLADDTLGFTLVTSPNHCVNIGDYLYFLGAIGTTTINTQIGMVTTTPSVNTFVVDILFDSGTYLGLGTYTRLCQPLLQTKQFPVYWEQGRQVRLGVQKYLMDSTADGQVTVNISLSQDPDTIYNQIPVVPSIGVTNSSLIYSQTLFTCPESTNIGLTPANTNLQTPTAANQFQIWHRLNTSLQGDTFQVGLTLSDDQMRSLNHATAEVTVHSMIFNVSPGPQLC